MNTVVREYIRCTPVVRVPARELGGAMTTAASTLTLKLEQLQCSGSFKARGAFANLLTRDVPPAGVLAASGGTTVSRSRTRPLGSVCPPTSLCRRYRPPRRSNAFANSARIWSLRAIGIPDALAVAEAFAAESGGLPIHAFDQSRVKAPFLVTEQE
jgi:threonine dehydratase